MKKLYALILSLCLVIGLFPTAIFAQEIETINDNSDDELIFYNTEIIVKINKYIKPGKFTFDNPGLFCGEFIYSSQLNSNETDEKKSNDQLQKDGYLEYTIRIVDGQRILEVRDRLRKRDDVISAELHLPQEGEHSTKTLVGIDEVGIYKAYNISMESGSLYIDPAEYEDGGVLFGVPIKSIRIVSRVFGANATQEEIDEYFKTYKYVMYVVEIDHSANIDEALSTFSNVNSLINISKQRFEYPTDDNPYEYGTRNIGDVNDNGEIDSMDYILLKRAYFGTYNLEYNELVRADINKNDTIDSLDYMLLKRVYFGTWNFEESVATPDEISG